MFSRFASTALALSLALALSGFVPLRGNADLGASTALAQPALSFTGDCTSVSSCQLLVLTLINAVRAHYKVRQLGLNVTESTGQGRCVGSKGHSTAMELSGTIWHTAPGDNPLKPTNKASFPKDICVRAKTAGENVGVAAGQTEGQNLATIMTQMMGESPDTPSGCHALPPGETNHACNIISPAFSTVGIGLIDGALSQGLTGPYLTEDFTG
jgi:hypothetical protein